MANYLKNVFLDLKKDVSRGIRARKVQGVDALLFLTYRCTSRCKTCNMWKRAAAERSQELEWPQWQKVLSDFKEYGIKTVEIFGGDALLRKGVIFNMIRFCSDNGIDTFFPTNSILLDAETAQKLVDADLGTIYFSLDDVGEESDRIRGVNDSFPKVKEALEALVAARGDRTRPKIIICTTISNLNYHRLDKVIQFLSQYPVNSVYPRPLGEFRDKNIKVSKVNGILPEPYFITTEGESHLLSQDQLRVFRESVRELKKKYCSKKPYVNFRAVDMAPDSAFTEGSFGTRNCHCCTTFVTVAPNGEVMPCPFFPHYTMGSLIQKPLHAVWGEQNPKHADFVRAQLGGQLPVCDNCNMRPYYPDVGETVQYYLGRIGQKLRS